MCSAVGGGRKTYDMRLEDVLAVDSWIYKGKLYVEFANDMVTNIKD